MFRQPMFIRGKRDLLRFITRNQRKVQKEEGNSEGREEKKEKKPSYVEKIVQEVDRIRQQQLGLESMLSCLEKKSEEADLSAQMMQSKFYHRYHQLAKE